MRRAPREHRDRRLGIGPPPERDARASSSRAAPSRGPAASHARAIRIASRARRSASENVPSSIGIWASPATTVARAADGVARHEIDGPPPRGERPFGVAGHAQELAEPVVDEPQPGPVATRIRAGDRRVEVRRRANGRARRECRLRGAQAELGHGRRLGPRPCVPRPRPGRTAPARDERARLARRRASRSRARARRARPPGHRRAPAASAAARAAIPAAAGS